MSKHFEAKQRFDEHTKRHYLNDEVTVLHCHHYATLFAQLADDAKLLHGGEILVSSCATAFGGVLKKYFADHNISDLDQRLAVAEEYWSFVGMGKVEFEVDNANGGFAEMKHSHVDEGWIKKFGKRTEPVNFFGQGFVIGAVAAATDSDFDAYVVEEIASIVSGAQASKFNVKRK